MSADKNNLEGTVSMTYVDNQAMTVAMSLLDQGLVASDLITPSKITQVYHPHHDPIRIRVLEEMVQRLLEIVEKDPDSPSEVSKLRQDFQGWRSELKDSTIVDHVYVPTYEINYQSLPYRLNVKGLSTKPPSAE